MAYIKDTDGTIQDNEGNVVFYSYNKFLRDICEGTHCFLCGASPEDKEFNEEHVIPKWVLRKCDLFKQSVTLPNGVSLRYDKYTVPCCKECNTFLGKSIEEPIREAVEGGLKSVNNYIKNNGSWNIFIWLSLIFFKTHLKDSYLRKHLDKRKGNETIASDYDWGLMHHIHCIVRAIKTGATIDNECFGTTMILPAKESDHYQSYDYRDIYSANTILIRVGEVAFLSVLDDSCASANFFSNHSKKINGQLSPLQLREVLSHLTLLNSKLKHRPSYYTWVNPDTNEISISARLPESMELIEYSREEFGEILYTNVSEFVDKMNSPDTNFTEKNIRKGMYHFLFDENGEFNKNSMELIEAEDEIIT